MPHRELSGRPSDRVRVGLIADTHGLLRPEAKEFLRGCNYIVHGGDIGSRAILDELAVIAPVTAVRGNNDEGPWANALRDAELLEIGAIRIYAIHDFEQLELDPAEQRIRVVVSGHSHKPSIKESNGVLYVNPGSAGRRRFKLPIAIGELTVVGNSVAVRIVELASGDLSPVRCLLEKSAS
jgi:putative phosphoesterase